MIQGYGYKRLLALFGLCVFCIGCSESGAPSSEAGSPSSGDIASAGQNGIHFGEIWVTDISGTYRTNLQSGKKTLVSAQDSYPTRDGNFFVLREKAGSRQDPHCSFRRHDDVTGFLVVNSHTRTRISEFDSIRRIISPIRLSPDVKRVGMFASEIEACDTNFNNIRFMVFSVDGEELYRDTGPISDFDWHPDGRLVVLIPYTDNTYSVEIETRPGSYEFYSLFKFTPPPGVYGYRGLRVGPTGNDAVIETVTAQNQFLSGVRFRDGAVHHFPLFSGSDVGETDLFKHGEGVSRVNGATFSPDGKHILVTEGYSRGAHIYSTSDPDISVVQGLAVVPVLPISMSYVVPVDTRLQLVPPEQFSEKIQPVLTTRRGRLAPETFNPLFELTWTPAIICNPELVNCD